MKGGVLVKKLSFIFALLLIITLFSTSCIFLDPGNNGIREYFGHTHAEYLTALRQCADEIKPFDFSVFSIDLDGNPNVTESIYAFYAVCEWSLFDHDNKSFILANSEIILYLNDAEISDSEVKIKLYYEHKPDTEDVYLVPNGSRVELVAINIKSDDYQEDKVDKYYEYYDNDICSGEKRYEFVYPYSLNANGKSYGTIKFSCAEELSEEALDELCERVLANVVVVNDR